METINFQYTKTQGFFTYIQASDSSKSSNHFNQKLKRQNSQNSYQNERKSSKYDILLNNCVIKLKNGFVLLTHLKSLQESNKKVRQLKNLSVNVPIHEKMLQKLWNIVGKCEIANLNSLKIWILYEAKQINFFP